MKKLTVTICLTLAVLLGSVGTSWGADFNKGVAAYQSGDYTTALREWTPLAEKGYVDAQIGLGMIYENGKGVPQDYKTAFKWFSLAAEQGHTLAQTKMGFMYYNGYGVPQDYQTAFKWISLAAEQGYNNAQYNLGVMYDKGDGVIQDNVYAHMWWNIAASRGHEIAANNRESIAKGMTPTQIEKAQELARECVAKKYKGC